MIISSIKSATLLLLIYLMLPASVTAQTVAILDQGVNTRLKHKASKKFVSQQCVSYKDDFFKVFGPLSPGQKPTASLCRNGLSKDLTGSSSASHPRRFLEPINNITLTTSSKLLHGRDMSDALYDFDRSIFHKPFQVFGLAGNLSSGTATATLKKIVATPTNYKTRNGEKIVEALKILANDNDPNLSAVVIATVVGNGSNVPFLCLQDIGQQYVDRLRNRGIAVVAGLHNKNISANGQSWPNCLRNVINVGNTNTRHTRDGIGIGANGIDFYSNSKTVTSDYIVYGNSFAAPKIAGAFALLRKAVPNSSVEAQYNALVQANNRGYTYNGVTRREIRKSHIASAINILKGLPPVDPIWSDPVNLQLNVADSTKYGWQYGTNNHKNGVIAFFQTPSFGLAVNSKIAKASSPVVRFSLRAYDIDSANEVQVLVNDKPYGYLNTTGNNRLGNRQTLCINQTDLGSVGRDNDIKLRVNQPGNTWGITELKIQNGVRDSDCSNPPGDSFEESVDLNLNQLDTKRYGKNYGRDQNDVELQVRFTPQPGRSHTVSWQAYDIEVNSMSLFLNGQLVKTLNSTSSGRLGQTESITLPIRSLRSGVNTLNFKAITSNNTWGVTNLLVSPIGDGGVQPGTEILADLPGPFGWVYQQFSSIYHFDFRFTRAGAGYRHKVEVSFYGKVRELGVNGFHIKINGRLVKVFPTRQSQSNTPRLYRAVFDQNQFNNGENRITIEPSSNVPNEAVNWGFKDFKIESELTPLSDLRVSSISLPNVVTKNAPFTIHSTVINTGKANSQATFLDYYKSVVSNGNNKTLLGSKWLGSLGINQSKLVSHDLSSKQVKDGDYIFSCVRPKPNEWSTSNNCSKVIQIEVVPLITPILHLLLGQ